jgi:tetratricopeptide (TPR) repeat protein
MRNPGAGIVMLVAMGLALVFFFADRAGANEPWVVKIVSVQGHVEARKSGTPHWLPVKLDDRYQPGDMIRLHENSRASVALPNQTILRLDQNTTVTFSALEKQQTWLVDLLRGSAYFFSRIPRTLRVATPFVNGSVEGTEFLLTVEADRAVLTVLEGRILAENKEGSLALTSGEAAVSMADQAPKLRTVVRPRDSVQWALHYPFLANYEPEELVGRAESGWPAVARRSRDFYWQGDLPQALSVIEGVPEHIRTARFFIYRASLFLSVGRVDRAQSDLRKALQVDPSQGDALAIEALVALTQNRKAEADELIRRATELSPNSPVVKLASSYVWQAHFDLQSAMTSVEDSLRVDPKNALSWARLSDLHLSFGYLDKALEAAQEAASLNPHLARTQTVLGFAYLTQIKTKESRDAFESAILLDQADPMPRLGLGLAKIRDGDLEDGRRELEIAVSLDLNNSLMRSYLGKAYFEEKRDKLAANQFTLAKELDPMDPTPWFYDAIQKQTMNRPVEALQDLQKSIELNENRAVYRSRLLLDQDLAARSTSLARIYGDLGFQQIALVEGWKSLNVEPGNYSSHRLLADSYSSLPRHEIARVSELLQSQLLQPININPVQPSLAESKLFIQEGAGPRTPSFSEFSPLFVRNRFAVDAGLLAGEQSTFGGEITQSTVWNKLSYSLGLFHYETDGFRENDDLRQGIFNIFAQYSLSPETSLQAEFRHVDRKNGQLDLLFDPALSTRFREEQEADIMRFGFHHAFSPGSDLIGSLIYQSVDIDNSKTSNVDATPPVISAKADTVSKTNRRGYIAELQHLLKTEKFNIISGIGFTNQDAETTINIDLFDVTTPLPSPPFPPGLPPLVIDPPPTDPIREKIDFERANIYAYSQIKILDPLSLTLGLSADSLDWADQIDRKQVNPKFGVTWQVLSATTVRAAAFRELGNRLFFSQTIEPTQVAGFNQFFDDISGTDSWRYGAAVDQKFSSSLYGGVEYSIRDLDVPLLAATGSTAQYFGWDEQFGRGYLYWTPHKMLALSLEYQYEQFDRSENPFQQGIVDVTTHRVALGAGFFHPSGITIRLKSTYYDQSGDFQRRDSTTIFSGQDDFWVFDAVLQYRLPKRYGLISVGVNNLFDTQFLFQDTDPARPTVIPKRFFFGRISLSF